LNTIFKEGNLPDAIGVQKKLVLILKNVFGNMKNLFQTQFIEHEFLTGSVPWYQDATTLEVKHSTTMVGEVLKFLSHGEKTDQNFLNTSLSKKDGISNPLTLTESTSTKVMNLEILGSLQDKKIQKTKEMLPSFRQKIQSLSNRLLDWKKKSEVYDLSNSGPRHRYTILTAFGPMIVHNSGYGMGWKKFMKTCQDFGQEVTVEVAKKAIEAYREKHAPVVALWNNLEKAAIKAVENPGKTYKINNTKWYMEGDFLVCQLPSGRCLHYYGAKIKYERTPWGQSKANLYHWTVDSKTKKWTFTKTWGGVLTQNCVGGISRDLLAASMVRVKENKFTVLLTVHDEVVAQRKKGFGDEHTFHKLMAMTPEWAKGCPVAAEGYKDSRYHK
jgi:hypothetical protein